MINIYYEFFQGKRLIRLFLPIVALLFLSHFGLCAFLLVVQSPERTKNSNGLVKDLQRQYDPFKRGASEPADQV